MTILNYDIMGDCVVDYSVDHDIFISRPRKEIIQTTKEELKKRDVPETQIQIVET